MTEVLATQGRTVVETAALVRSGELTAVGMVTEALDRIERCDRMLGAFVHVDAEGALARASAVDRLVADGGDPGPMAGVPLGVKELHPVAGWPFAMGSTLYAGRTADHTCTLVTRAVRAGAVPIGVTASPEFGRASFTASTLHGVTRNPWNPALTPGGSSGGSAAAVAAGMVPIATGTDGAGSLRIPASYCGLVGFKPTYGLVPRGPRHAGAADNDHYGALTRTVRDTARFLDCVCGTDPFDRASLPAPPRFEDRLGADPGRLRVAFAENLGNAPCDPAVAEVVRTAAEKFLAATGAEAVPARLTVDPRCGAAYRTLSAPDVYSQLRDVPAGSDIHPTLRGYLEAATAVDADALADAHAMRAGLVATVAEAFERFSLLLLPATQVPAFPAEGPMPTEIAGTPVDHWGALAVTFPFNLTGQPAISVPAGTVAGVPVGLQIVGHRHSDALVLTAAAVVEEIIR
ncbi:amidase [Mycolicibacterium litorale]|uniref:amidase n=1 Tax=Mycolicibacterium litorale TaxID=758802 RepID=A0AAD1IN45_9MYCO|nr:amidase [Mycolicibacterium litorale]MCV7416314.1 amidase [Mycolicibacterium litorale]TDY09568.1 aspartyl-tRNA(Asn)/glutamyl-tRNA(Gln) amidotransferase subunit A [Mycolicibacterium litorale]BBY17513.1 amidase [Mycolicibacterium litorale]